MPSDTTVSPAQQRHFEQFRDLLDLASRDEAPDVAAANELATECVLHAHHGDAPAHPTLCGSQAMMLLLSRKTWDRHVGIASIVRKVVDTYVECGIVKIHETLPEDSCENMPERVHYPGAYPLATSILNGNLPTTLLLLDLGATEHDRTGKLGLDQFVRQYFGRGNPWRDVGAEERGAAAAKVLEWSLLKQLEVRVPAVGIPGSQAAASPRSRRHRAGL
ncbi:hypothetical protein ABIC83_002743 [Roseateles asaccharophilus]|uniref:hypothetical protein n=1 Tax=Roseateles asaccharophilus TaxID=582607 RepID=UPI0038392908